MKPINGPNSLLILPEDAQDVTRLRELLQSVDMGDFKFNPDSVRQGRPLSTIYSGFAFPEIWRVAGSEAALDQERIPELNSEVSVSDWIVINHYFDRHFKKLAKERE